MTGWSKSLFTLMCFIRLESTPAWTLLFDNFWRRWVQWSRLGAIDGTFWPKFPNNKITTWSWKMRFGKKNKDKLKIHNTLYWKKIITSIASLPSKTSEILKTTLRSGWTDSRPQSASFCLSSGLQASVSCTFGKFPEIQ